MPTSSEFDQDQEAQPDASVEQTQSPISPSHSGSFDYLYFAKFLAFRNLEIIPLSELTDSETGKNLAEFVADQSDGCDGRRHGNGTSWRVLPSVEWKSHYPKVAAKIPWTRKNYLDIMKNCLYDIQIMSHSRLCDHINIVKLLGLAMYDMKSENHRESEHVTKSKNENGAIYPVVVVEAADSEYPDLKQFMEDCPRQGPIPLDLVYDFICDIADGLTALHNFGVVHGDIKPENILLFENVKKGRPVLKICDFGSTQVDVVSTDGIRGATEAWLAPEFYLFRKEVHKPTVDVFSFGLVSCYLASGGMMPDKFSGRWRRVIEDCYSTIPLSRLEPLFNILEHALKPKPDERLPTLLDISTHLLSRLMSYYPKLPISLRKKVFEQLQFSIQNETPIPGDIQEAHFWLSQVEKEFPILPPSASAFQLSFKTIGNPSRRREVATAMACLVSSPLKAHIRDFEDRLDAVQAGNTDIDDLFVPSKEGGYNCFHAAVYENLPYVISRLKNAGGDVNMTADGNWSPLHEAVLLGRVSCASELLKCGANINENSDKGGTPLTLSIIAPPSRNRDMFNLLLSFNANPCIPHNGMYRDTAAHFAASLWVEGLQILLNRDPDLAFAVDSVGATPLHLAALDGNVESIKMLVKLGSDVNAKDVDDHTPLHNCWAMFQVKQHIPSMPWENRDITPYRQARELLIASGADLESRNRYGAKPSTWALQSPFAQALSTFDRARMTRILGSDPRSWEGSQSNVPDAWQARRSLPSIQCC